jgi:hypothetical protein
MLRQRAVQLLARLRQLPLQPGQPAELPPALLTHAPQLFKLAFIAVGDADSAAVLTADVLAQAPAHEGLAALVERLPQGWLSWPGAAGPSEWLTLRLRREQADRLLSVLGEWDAEERIALALYLLWDVRRDELDSWMGTSGMAERVAEFISYVGEGLSWVEPGGSHPDCAEIADDLLDARESQIGRMIRLHTIGCDACHQRVSGLRRTADLLRLALNTFFRATLPPNFRELIQTRQRHQPHTRAYWKPALVAVVLLALLTGVFQRSESAEVAQAEAPPSAAELIDRALHRFAQPTLLQGVLHERVRLGTDDTAMLVERWYDYHSPQRLRVTVRHPQQAAPALDLATDGTSWIAYEVNHGSGHPVSALVRNADIDKLMPMLRQLPFSGSFSETPVEQDRMDLALLAQAQHGTPVLLGTTFWRDRPAYMLSSVTKDVGRIILTIDRETLSVLEARIAPNVAGATDLRRVWEAEVVEVLPRTVIPANTFTLSTRSTVVSQLDPRQFVLYPISSMDLNTAVRYGSLPVPTYLPDPTLIAHLRGLNGLNASLLQMHESEWSTLAIVTPRVSLRAMPWERLDRRFAQGRYMIRPLELPQATMAWFVMDGVPNQIMQLYFWHALASEAEREQMVTQILDALVLVNEDNASTYNHRFLSEPEPEKTGNLSLPQPRQRTNAAILSPAQMAQRRYFRSKLEQLDNQQPAPRRSLLVR